MEMPFRFRPRKYLLVLIGAFLLCLLLLANPLWESGRLFLLRAIPELFTGPISEATQAKLCHILQLSDQDPRCLGQAYAYEFLADFRRRYGRYGRDVPYTQIDSEIGFSLAKCTGWEDTSSDGTFRTCDYDFKGDGVFVLSVNYRRNHPEVATDQGDAWSVCSYAVRNVDSRGYLICEPP